MAGSSSKATYKEYVLRVPKPGKKRYHMMQFNADFGEDFFKTWSQCKIERENNIKEFKAEEETPKFGAGSEFGREQKEEARRIRLGINLKRYRPEHQPWLLTIGGKHGKKFKGIREGGVADNMAWYVFMHGKDGAFEAYPIDEWYNFQPINRYKALTAEEAEKEFERRDKIMNYFQVMYDKKYKKDDAGPDDEDGNRKGYDYNKLKLSEIDDWVSDDDDNADEDGLEASDGDETKKKKGKAVKKGKKAQGGKKKTKKDNEESDNSCIEESDDYDEGAEHDYISSDSSNSEAENEEAVTKDLAGVEEGDALKKLLASEDEEDENENKDKDKEDKDDDSEDGKKKKKKKKRERKQDNESEYSTESSSDESKKKDESEERKQAVTDIKRRVKENIHDVSPAAKKPRIDRNSTVTSSNNALVSGSDTGVTEEAIRRYLMRKPMTTTELLQKFKSKKTGLSSEELVQSIAQILKRINPIKQMWKGKMYLSIKT